MQMSTLFTKKKQNQLLWLIGLDFIATKHNLKKY